MHVERGEFVAIVGTSGSGKTTLLNILGALATPTGGEVNVDGVRIDLMTEREKADFRNRKIGHVFQAFHILPDRSALANVMLPALLANRRVNDARERAISCLKRVGLADKSKSHPSSLSGGQLQRIAIARALMMTPSILLADEPTGNLDTHTTGEIVALFHALHEEEKLTLVVVTHEDVVAKSAQRVLHLEEGVIVEKDA